MTDEDIIPKSEETSPENKDIKEIKEAEPTPLSEDKSAKEEGTSALLGNKSAKEGISDPPENKSAKEEGTSALLGNKSAKEGSFMPMIVVMLASLAIAFLWDKVPAIKNSIHTILNPTAGALMNWNLTLGLVIIVFVITLVTTLVQKYTTDQKTLKELKAEQKEIQKQMKEFKSHPEKLMDLQKKQMALFPKQMKLGMRAIIYTGVPLIIFFRWFYDFFATIENVSFFGITKSWFLVYLVFALVFSAILRKWMDVV